MLHRLQALVDLGRGQQRDDSSRPHGLLAMGGSPGTYFVSMNTNQMVAFYTDTFCYGVTHIVLVPLLCEAFNCKFYLRRIFNRELANPAIKLMVIQLPD